MNFPKLFLLILSFWGIVFSARTEHSMADTWTRDQTSRSLLQSGIPNTCNAETNVRWYDSPPTAYRNITSAGDCCAFCQQTPGCLAWVWRSIGQVCYLLYAVGNERFCSRCTGGRLDNAPVSPSDIEDYLQRCADQGGRAGRTAAIAACLVVTDTCAPAAPVKSLLDTAEAQLISRREEVVLERSCDLAFSQTCRTEARNQASSVSPGCDAILDRGPGESREGCEDRDAARRIFNEQIAELCAAPT